MTERIPGLMGFVARALKAEPGLSSSELYERSRVRYPAVTEMTVRQFHARYPLQVKRQLNDPLIRRFPLPKPEKSALEAAAPPAPTAAEPPPPESTAEEPAEPTPARGETGTRAPKERRAAGEKARAAREERAEGTRRELRTLFFRLAVDLETAPGRADVVDVMARIDGYADEALAIAGGGA